MRDNEGIKLNFRIDDDHLIVHTLSSMGSDRFSSTRHKKDIVAFQNYAWRQCKQCYNLLVGGLSAESVANGELRRTCSHLPKFLDALKQSMQFEKIRRQTEEYLGFCQHQWNGNYLVSCQIVGELTGLRLNREFTVYVTHPSLKKGHYCGDNTIEWGHNEDWPNYATVYLWHEVLHSYIFCGSDIEHAVIELVTDEELRTRLNGSKYPPFVGHKHLAQVKRKLLSYWKKYLRLEKRKIREFIKRTRMTLAPEAKVN